MCAMSPRWATTISSIYETDRRTKRPSSRAVLDVTELRPDPAEMIDTIGATAPLLITVSHGVAAGPTKLAAFDEALQMAGIGNYNLIHLSSVIPPNSIVRSIEGQADLVGAWGDRCYVILAEGRIDTPHEEIWAGLGWAQEDASGRGLFVEHVGHSEAQVCADIEASLEAMIVTRPQVRFGDRHSVVQGAVCIDEPVCGLVAAAIQRAPWQSEPDIIVLF